VTRVPTAGDNSTLRRRELGALLKGLRTEKGLSVKQVARQLRVSSPQVSRFESGQRGIKEEDIQKLCDLYEVSGEQR
jgi:transcriptional regulator with XRE-family HTH domain